MSDETIDTPTPLDTHPVDETLERRDYPQSERDDMDKSDFGDPENEAFPIKVAKDVIHAAERLHNAKGDQATIKARIIRIAKRKGFPLPKTWQEGDDDKKEERSVQALTSDALSVYLPITRRDEAKRMVFGQATVEQPDAYGTIFGYYPDAWKAWRGNIREQHDSKKAVGKAVELDCNDTQRAIFVGSRISRGAQDTWLKVEDDVLTGYSASILPDPQYGNDTRNWPRKEYKGKEYPYLPRYSVVELSLVDNPATPGCNISIVRANGMTTDVLDTTEEQPPAAEEPKPQEQPIERAGARISHVSQDSLHSMRNSDALNLLTVLKHCDCEECQGIAQVLDPDDDGDVDIIPSLDYDSDNGGISRNAPANPDFERSALAIVERMLQPVYARLQAIAGDFARNNQPLERSIPTNQQPDTETLTRALSALDAKIDALAATTSSYDEVRSALAEVKGQVDRIAAQPLPGGPVLNGAYPVDKRLATDPYAPTGSNQENQREVVERLHQAGAFKTLDDQIAAVATLIKPVPGGRR